MRRVGVLFAASADDPEYQGRIAAFTQALTKLGWIDGSNMRIDTRWGTTDSDLREHAAELASLSLDVIVAATGIATGDPHGADRLLGGHRPRRRRFRREPGAAWR